MSEQQHSGLYYIAPPDAPPSRRPPLTATGPLGWLRENLFSDVFNSVATIVTGGLIIAFLWGFLSWAMRDAQWAVVFNNLRLLSVGQYDKNEIWRVQLVAGILVFLTGMGLGIWGRVVRSVFIAVLITTLIILGIPILGAQVPEPSLQILLQPEQDYNATNPQISNFVFWQRRCYDHNCRSTESVWKKVNYCHNNPVKRGLVSEPDNWIWSSYRYYAGYKQVVLEMDIAV